LRSLPRILQAALLAIGLVGFGVVAQAQIAPYQASSNLQAAGTANSCVVSSTSSGSCVVAHCPSGQSGAVVYVPAGTSITGTVSVYTAADVNGSPGTYGTPYHSYAAQSSTDSNTLSSFPGRLYVQLGGDGWVEAVFTTATSGHATATITCSAAVTVQHVGLPLSVANGGTGTASPNPTATGCGTISGTWPSNVFDTTGCGGGGGSGPTQLSFGAISGNYYPSTTTFSFSGPHAVLVRAWVAGSSTSANVGVAVGTSTTNLIEGALEGGIGRIETYYNPAGAGLVFITTGVSGGFAADLGVHEYDLLVTLDSSNNVSVAGSVDRALNMGPSIQSGSAHPIPNATLALNSSTESAYILCSITPCTIVYADYQVF